jgi:hypothetical protein
MMSMKKLILAVIGAVAIASCVSVPARPIDFQNFGGSAFTIRQQPGILSKLYFKEDGTYVLVIPGAFMQQNGEWDTKGTWRMDGSNVCTLHTIPARANPMQENCLHIPVRNYGESFVNAGTTNGDIHITIERETTEF